MTQFFFFFFKLDWAWVKINPYPVAQTLDPIPYGLETLPTSLSLDSEKIPKIKNPSRRLFPSLHATTAFPHAPPPRADAPAARIGLSPSSFMGDHDKELPSPADPY
jgi:hypothetical protein